MNRTLITCLGLGVSAVALTNTPSGFAAPIVAGLAGGLGGNLLTDLWKILDRQVAQRILDHQSSIDENHHVSRALRLAQINALRSILKNFDDAIKSDPDKVIRSNGKRFSQNLKSFLDEEMKIARSDSFIKRNELSVDERAIQSIVLKALPDAFDQSLATRRSTGDKKAFTESVEQIRAAVEVAVLEEIRQRIFDDALGQLPPLFLSFFSQPGDPNSWFNLFVRDAASTLKDGGEFERIWNAEQMAMIKAIVEAHTALLSRIDDTTKRTENKIDDLPDALVTKILAALNTRVKMSTGSVGVSIQPKSLPIRPIRCLGRESDLQRSLALIAPLTAAASIIIFGGPGLGKSTLTREIACHETIVKKYADRRYFANLEKANNIEEFRETLAATIGQIKVSFSESVPLYQMLLNLGEGPILLILDNLETPWEASLQEIEAEIAASVSYIPKLSILASFRGNAVPSAPRWNLKHKLEPLSQEAAQVLFLDIASSISNEDPALQPLLSALGGVPLAIELIAYHAAPFTSLESVLLEWERVGTALAKRNLSGESRTTSLDYSLYITIGSPKRNKRTAELLAIIAFLDGGVSDEVARYVLGECYFEVLNDIVTSGIGFNIGHRINILPPVRAYLLRNYPLQESYLCNVISAYFQIVYAASKMSDSESYGFQDLIQEEEFNFPKILLYATHRKTADTIYSAITRINDFININIDRIKNSKVQTAFIRLEKACSDVMTYCAYNQFRQKSYLFNKYLYMELACKRIKDSIMKTALFWHLEQMKLQLKDCTSDVRLKNEPKLAELERIYLDYFGLVCDEQISDEEKEEETDFINWLSNCSHEELLKVSEDYFSPDNSQELSEIEMSFSNSDYINNYKESPSTVNYINKGSSFCKAMEYEKALIAFNKATQEDENSEDAWLWKGDALVDLHRIDEAHAAYKKVLEINPDNDVALSNIGYCFVNEGKYVEAIDAYNQAILLNPKNDSAWSYKAIALINLAQYSEAISSTEKALALNPENEIALESKAFALSRLRLYDASLFICTKALEFNTKKSGILVVKSRNLNGLRRYNEALETCEHALALDQNSAAAWGNKGRSLVGLNELHEAKDAFSNASKLSHDQCYIEFYNACCFCVNQKWADSLTCLANAFDLNKSLKDLAMEFVETFSPLFSDPEFMKMTKN